ncbi:MAG: family oxidoreductase [Chitinophagaceae bacterium]|nr:family oxidoreductase [Chitinophagaceae bacterium]
MSYALITGASKGIGKAIAFELAKHNYNILLTARSAELLAQAAEEIKKQYPVTVNFLPLDLSELNAAQKLFNWCVENNFPVSVLANNAGYGLSGSFEKYSVEETTNLLQLNIIAPTQLCRLFIPLLKQQQQSYILNTCSSSAYQAVPLLTVYAASKAYVLKFTRALKHELADTNISVTCLSPGPTDTDWANRAQVSDKILKMAAKLNMTPQQVAVIGVKAMFKKRTEVVTGFINKLGVFMAWLLPDSLVEKSAGKLYK